MPSPIQTDELPRKTYEDVLKQQVALSKAIEGLIRLNQCLEDGDEKWGFYQRYQRATLGIGARTPLNSEVVPGSESWSIDHVIFNHLTGGIDTIRVGYRGSAHQKDLTPAILWGEVLKRLLGVVFGEALEQAAKMSPEKPGGEVILGT